jgi:hypothetical protein
MTARESSPNPERSLYTGFMVTPKVRGPAVRLAYATD